MKRFLPMGFGWHPDVPDFRDFSPNHGAVRELLHLIPDRRESVNDPSCVDLRDYFLRDVPDQLGLNASSAYASAALVEYFEYRTHGQIVNPSALFLYQTLQRLAAAECTIDCGLRATLKAMIRLGMPTEEYQERLEPTDPILFSFAEFYRTIRYVRLDSRDGLNSDTLKVVKSFLHAGFPVAFGFAVPGSVSRDANIEYRPTFTSIQGGQAVVAAGYDDRRKINGTTGALLIRNSWGVDWGDKGYGWLPYAFVERRLALDFWTFLKPDWLESGELSRPADIIGSTRNQPRS